MGWEWQWQWLIIGTVLTSEIPNILHAYLLTNYVVLYPTVSPFSRCCRALGSVGGQRWRDTARHGTREAYVNTSQELPDGR